MKLIATFNTNSIRARQGLISKWLKSRDCHLLCIQETKVQDKDFPVSTFEELGYHTYFKGQKSYNGVAIISKEPLKEVSFGFDDGQDTEEDLARLIRAQWDGFLIINVYVPQGRALDHPNFTKKLLWYDRLLECLERAYKPTMPIFIMGDFNCAPEPIDVYAPERKKDHVCFNESVREAFKRLLGWGLVDCFRAFDPSPNKYTFYDYRVPKAVQRGLGWRIDHILATEVALGHVKECYIDLEPRLWERPSDHTFLCAKVKSGAY